MKFKTCKKSNCKLVSETHLFFVGYGRDQISRFGDDAKPIGDFVDRVSVREKNLLISVEPFEQRRRRVGRNGELAVFSRRLLFDGSVEFWREIRDGWNNEWECDLSFRDKIRLVLGPHSFLVYRYRSA